jgi:hypothetical protein
MSGHFKGSKGSKCHGSRCLRGGGIKVSKDRGVIDSIYLNNLGGHLLEHVSCQISKL